MWDILCVDDRETGRGQESHDGENEPLITHAADNTSRHHDSQAASSSAPAGSKFSR